MKEETKRARWIIISVALILVSICIAIPADNKSEGSITERMKKASDVFVFHQRLAVMSKTEKLPGKALICVLVDRTACFDNKMDIKTKLEEYKQQYGFYPSEAKWDDFLNDPHLWPPDSPGPRYCLLPAYPYEYKSDSFPGSVLIKNEHGSGYSKYRMICSNPGCLEQWEPEYGE